MQINCYRTLSLCFQVSASNIRLNDIDDKVVSLNVGVGSESGSALFTVGKDTTNHIALEHESNTVEIELMTLNEILIRNDVNPEVVKIDVEGYEEQVLLGSSQLLSSSKCNIIIMEDVSYGLRYGTENKTIYSNLFSSGYERYWYDPFGRELHIKNDQIGQNTIFIRDIERAKERLSIADTVNINGLRF